MEKPLKVRLHILSPVHIGCDEVYEPTSFLIDEKKGRLIEFDPMDFIKSLSPQDSQMFSDLCMQGNISSIVNIYKFISSKQLKGREVEIASGLFSHYKKVRELPVSDERKIRNEINQFTISKTAHNPHSDQPYIPGSSLKGSLRTAYLSKLAKEQNVADCWNKYLSRSELKTDQDTYHFIGKKKIADRLEEDLLKGEFDKDPFRMVKPSDFLPINNVKTKIVYVVNKKKERSKFEAQGPFQIVETIKEGAIFEGSINIQQPEKNAGIQKPIIAKELLKSINAFYMPIFNAENEITKGIGAGAIVGNSINQKFKDKLGDTSFLIRIGRHSGAEAVTIEGNRYIKIMQGRNQPPKFLDQATTIWLASETRETTNNNGLVPFGWAVLEIIA